MSVLKDSRQTRFHKSKAQLIDEIEVLEVTLSDYVKLEKALRENEQTLERYLTDQLDTQERYQAQAADMAHLAEELSFEKQRAEAASEAKSQFLSSMSHELRTPLNAILGFAQLLQMDHENSLSKAQSDSVRNILSGGSLLSALIEDLLDLAQIETGNVQLNIEDIQPQDILQQTLLTANVLAEKRGITLVDQGTTKDLPSIRTDTTRLGQILLNLLANAIKYNRDAGTATLDCDLRPDGFLRISVTDTGHGIPVDKRDAVFEPFDRIGKEGKNIEGTGIGLTITKQLIEALGGHMDFESEVDKGSTFWVDLPLSEKFRESEIAVQVLAKPST